MAGRQRLMREVGEAAPNPPPRADELFDRLLHDLRNPIGVIAYYAEGISAAGTAERSELCERLRGNAQRALDVLEEFSLLGELRAGRSVPALEPCDLGAIVAEQARELEAFERRPGRIHCSIALDAPLRVARVQIICALRALLRVALRATAGDDPVELHAHAERPHLLFEITAPLRAFPGLGGQPRLPTNSIEIELAERVAVLHGGRFALSQEPGRRVMTLAVKT